MWLRYTWQFSGPVDEVERPDEWGDERWWGKKDGQERSVACRVVPRKDRPGLEKKSSVSVADPGCPSLDPDLGSRFQKQQKRQGWKKMYWTFFRSHKNHQIENYINFELVKKKFWANLQRIIELSTKKIVIKLSNICVWDPGSGKSLFRIPDPGPGVKKAPDPGSATPIGEVVRILTENNFSTDWEKDGNLSTVVSDPDPHGWIRIEWKPIRIHMKMKNRILISVKIYTDPDPYDLHPMLSQYYKYIVNISKVGKQRIWFCSTVMVQNGDWNSRPSLVADRSWKGATTSSESTYLNVYEWV